MTYEEKLKLILKAISEARKLKPSGKAVMLYISSDNGLDKILAEEIKEFLYQLQDQEKIITVYQATNRLLPLHKQPSHPNAFLIDILNKFDNWYSAFLLKSKSELENLSEKNFKNIAYLMKQMEEELEMAQSDTFVINFIEDRFDIIGYDREDIDDLISTYSKGLAYLKSIGVIKDFTSEPMVASSNIILNTTKFFEALERIKKIQGKNPEPQTAKITVKKQPKIVATKLSYDKKNRILKIDGKSVKFQNDSFRVKILELLLKDEKARRKEWSWDEVLEEIEGIKDQDELKANKKKFYPACDGLTKQIASKIGVNDLLIFNKSTVQINPKYL